MDLVLLLIQVLLVVLLIVIPLFSGYDKWQAWSPARKLTAVALGIGIAVVAFGQYKRLVVLHKPDLPRAFGPGGLHAPWYLRETTLTVWEYLGAVIAGSTMLGLAFVAAQRGRWTRVAGFVAAFLIMLAMSVALRLHWWQG
jgi:hypothetical protein